jgi:CHAT domain-containing protein
VHVVATDALAGLPFAVLLASPAPEDAPFAALDWLAQRHAFTVLPSVELLLHPEPPRPSTNRVYVGFGAPDYDLRLLDGNRAPIAGLRPLPESGDEVIAVAEIFAESEVYLNFVANEWALQDISDRNLFANGGVLHLATHGVAPLADPAVPAGYLALSPDPAGMAAWRISLAAMSRVIPDGALMPEEIALMRLPADLVILSACDGAVDPDPLSGVGGLAAAFLRAGARRVMASHWPVNSVAAVEIVTAMMESDPQMQAPAQALQAAMRDLIAQGGHRADPGYWGPFSLIGAP